MRLRHGLIVGIGVAITAAPPTATRAWSQSSRTTVATGSASLAIIANQPASFGTIRVHTLTDALAASYANNPALQSERAKLRATDEGVPQALSGWRPQVSLSGTAGYGENGRTRSPVQKIARPEFLGQ